MAFWNRHPTRGRNEREQDRALTYPDSTPYGWRENDQAVRYGQYSSELPNDGGQGRYRPIRRDASRGKLRQDARDFSADAFVETGYGQLSEGGEHYGERYRRSGEALTWHGENNLWYLSDYERHPIVEVDTSRPRPGPKNYQRSDERIREDVCEQLTHQGHLDVSAVSVEVHGGHVVLEGEVPERRMKYEIEDIAAGCLGVMDITNRIRVSRDSS